jgi:hypothetical protein
MAAFRTDRPRAARDVLRGLPHVRSAALFGDTVHALLDPGADMGAARRSLEEASLSVADMEEIEPSLEDVFIHLVEANHRLVEANHA